MLDVYCAPPSPTPSRTSESARIYDICSQTGTCLENFGKSITDKMTEILKDYEADVARVLFDTNGKGDKACSKIVPRRVDLVTERLCMAMRRLLREEFGRVDRNITHIFHKLHSPSDVDSLLSMSYQHLGDDPLSFPEELPTDLLDFAREIPYIKLQNLQTLFYAQIGKIRGEVQERIEHVASYYGKMSRKEIKNKACRTLHDYLENEMAMFTMNLVLQRCNINSMLADSSLGFEE